MKNITKIAGAIAMAGAIAAGSSAFTAGGLTDSAPVGWIGGEVRQTVVGAALDSIRYTFAPLDTDSTTVTGIELVFVGDVAGGTVEVDVDGETTPFTCTVPAFVTPNTTSTCTGEAPTTAFDTIDIRIQS